MTKTEPATILIPSANSVPLILKPGIEGYVDVFANGRPFKIMGAEPVEGIDYSAFVCPGFWLGALNVPAPPNEPWPVALMFSGFLWPGGGMTDWGSRVPYLGDVDFRFRILNRSNEDKQFAIKLVGLELLR